MMTRKNNVTVAKLVIVVARFRVHHDKYFTSFSYFANLFHEPLGE